MLMLHDGGYSQHPARDTSSHDILSHNILPATSGRKTPCPRHPAATSCHETSHHARFRYVISATFGAKTKRTNFADKYIEQKKDDCAKYTITHYGNFHSTKCHNLQHIFSSPVDNFYCFIKKQYIKQHKNNICTYPANNDRDLKIKNSQTKVRAKRIVCGT